MCGGNSVDDGRDSLAGTSGNMGQSVASPSGVDTTTTGYRGDGGRSGGSADAQAVGGDVAAAPAQMTAAQNAALADVDRARAVLEGYSTTNILGNVGMADDEGLTLGGAVTPAGTLTSSTKVRMQEPDRWGTFVRSMTPFSSSSTTGTIVKGAGTVADAALKTNFLGTAASLGWSIGKAVFDPDYRNMTGPGGRYHWDSKAYLRSRPEEKEKTFEGGVRFPVDPSSVEETATSTTSTATTTTKRRAAPSTIFTSVFGDPEEANVIRSRLGGSK